MEDSKVATRPPANPPPHPSDPHQQPPMMQNPPPGQQQQAQQLQQTTTVIINQPKSQHGQPQNVRDWSTGLCGCCEDCGGCLYCFFCYPCFMCTLASRMDECVCGPFFCKHFFTVPMRTKMRTQHGISGSIFEDIICVGFCEICSMHQIYRELNNIGKLQ